MPQEATKWECLFKIDSFGVQNISSKNNSSFKSFLRKLNNLNSWNVYRINSFHSIKWILLISHKIHVKLKNALWRATQKEILFDQFHMLCTHWSINEKIKWAFFIKAIYLLEKLKLLNFFKIFLGLLRMQIRLKAISVFQL
jgi:hypothetical protein